MNDTEEPNEIRRRKIQANLLGALGPFDVMASLIVDSQHKPNNSNLFGLSHSPVVFRNVRSCSNFNNIPNPSTSHALRTMQNVEAPLSTLESNLNRKKAEMRDVKVHKISSPSTSAEKRKKDGEEDEETKRKRKRIREDLEYSDSEAVKTVDYQNGQKPSVNGIVDKMEIGDSSRYTMSDLFGDEVKRVKGEESRRINTDLKKARNMKRDEGGECSKDIQIKLLDENNKATNRMKRDDGGECSKDIQIRLLDENNKATNREIPDSQHEKSSKEKKNTDDAQDLENMLEFFSYVNPLLSPPTQPSSILPKLENKDGTNSLKCVLDLSVLAGDQRDLIARILASKELLNTPRPALSPPSRPSYAGVCSPSAVAHSSVKEASDETRQRSKEKHPGMSRKLSPAIKKHFAKKEKNRENSPVVVSRKEEDAGVCSPNSLAHSSVKEAGDDTKQRSKEELPGMSRKLSPAIKKHFVKKEKNRENSPVVVSRKEEDAGVCSPNSVVKEASDDTKQRSKEEHPGMSHKPSPAIKKHFIKKEKNRDNSPVVVSRKEENAGVCSPNSVAHSSVKEAGDDTKQRSKEEHPGMSRKSSPAIKKHFVKKEKNRDNSPAVILRKEEEERAGRSRKVEENADEEKRVSNFEEGAKENKAIKEELISERFDRKSLAREVQSSLARKQDLKVRVDSGNAPMHYKNETTEGNTKDKDKSTGNRNAVLGGNVNIGGTPKNLLQNSRVEKSSCCAFECAPTSKYDFPRNKDGSFKNPNVYIRDFVEPLKQRSDKEVNDKVKRVLYYMESVSYSLIALGLQVATDRDENYANKLYMMIREVAELFNHRSLVSDFYHTEDLPPLAKHFVSRVRLLAKRSQAICFNQLFRLKSSQATKNCDVLSKYESKVNELERAALRGEAVAVNGGALPATPSPASSLSSSTFSERPKEIVLPLNIFQLQKSQIKILHNLLWAWRTWEGSTSSMSQLEKDMVEVVDKICGKLTIESDLIKLSEYLATSVVWLREEYNRERS